MRGSTDDGRTGGGTPRGDEEPTVPAGLCPRCGRALPGHLCLHCAGEDEFGDAALVRRFVSFPDLYSEDAVSQSWPDPGPGQGSAPGDRPPTQPPEPGVRLPTQAPEPAANEEPAVPDAYRERFDATPDVVATVRTRDLLDPTTGWGPRGILAKVVIAGGSILLAAVVGIAGAVVTGPVATGPTGAPTLLATPSPQTLPGSVTAPPPAPPTRAATGAVVQGSFCLDDYAGGTDNGNPIQLWECENKSAQRWTFATDGTVRVFDKCMRPVRGASAYGTTLELWDCDRTTSQQWLRGPDGSLLHPASGACLEDPGPGDAKGSRPQLAACISGPDQQWNLP